MNQLFNEFLLLEREVASGGQTMESDLSKKVAAYLSVFCQHFGTYGCYILNVAGGRSKGVMAEAGCLCKEGHQPPGSQLEQHQQWQPEQPGKEDSHFTGHQPEPGDPQDKVNRFHVRPGGVSGSRRQFSFFSVCAFVRDGMSALVRNAGKPLVSFNGKSFVGDLLLT